MAVVHTLQELDEFLLNTDRASTDEQRRVAWASLKVEHGMFAGFPEKLAALDPFAAAYAKTVD